MMDCDRIAKPSQRGGRKILKALRNYLTADSFMYGPLIYPLNYTSSSGGPSAPGKFWQIKKTNVTLSSEVHKSLKLSTSHQSNETRDSLCNGDHEVHFRKVPLDSIENVKRIIDISASPSTMDNTIHTDKPTSVTRKHVEKEKRAHQDIDDGDLSPLLF